jgi:hypothetical protein
MKYVTIGGAVALGLAVLSASVTLVPVAAQQPTFQRKALFCIAALWRVKKPNASPQRSPETRRWVN